MNRRLLATIALAALATFSSAYAHHSVNAQFKMAEDVELSGVLVKLENVNPHSRWHFAIKNEKGATENWVFGKRIAGGVARVGVKVREDIKVGDTYKVYFKPPRNPEQKIGWLWSIEIKGRKVSISNAGDVRPE